MSFLVPLAARWVVYNLGVMREKLVALVARQSGPSLTNYPMVKLPLLNSTIYALGSRKLFVHSFLYCLAFLVLCSCAFMDSASVERPADLNMNKGAGRGDELLATVHLEDGHELLMIVDTGAPYSLLDESLKPILGKPVGKFTTGSCYGKANFQIYRAPKLYLGDIQLRTWDEIATSPIVKQVSNDLNRMMRTNRPIMGVLGMDCLKHYCLQLDFEAGRIRFLDPKHSNPEVWGEAFPLRCIHGAYFFPGNLAGTKESDTMIDTGCNFDGFMMAKLLGQWTGHAQPPLRGEARSPNAIFAGQDYPDIHLTKNDDGNGIGLSFLARHLVTIDFPNRKLYLQRTSVGPLKSE